MKTEKRKQIKVKTTVYASAEEAWRIWTEPEHVKQWNYASEDWHTPSAVNDLSPGGTFSFRMEARDGSEGFDFAGTYDAVEPHQCIAYTLDDGRRVEVKFVEKVNTTDVIETFEPETTFSEEFQKQGWQSILDNFKKYAEKEL